MADGTKEYHLEDHIEKFLISSPQSEYGIKHHLFREAEYKTVAPTEYDKDRCLIPSELIAFLRKTQPTEYDKLIEALGSESKAEKSLLDRLETELKQGTLSVLRNTMFDAGYGARFRMLYFQPVNNKSPEHEAWYAENRLAVVRQLKYSNKNNNSIDMVIFLNGLPIITIELKNTLTGQTHHNAIKQYMEDRPIDGEKLLEFKRCLVHFAVGTEQVFMTTRLDGRKTRFFPFNVCYANEKLPNKGYKSSYLWEDVLRRESILDLIQNYISIQTTEELVYNEKSRKLVSLPSTALIFPRYHQRRAVHKIVKDVKENGAGKRYLIQHSAGSGKSNTITWLAFRLSSLYQHYTDEKALYDSVLVVTDRKVLDNQLQANLRQFDLTPGEVAYIDDNCSSQDLKKAIESRKRIIVSTLQKFPVISETISMFPDRNYAVIIDEAHSSQSGDAARHMRKALSLSEAEVFDKEVELEDDIDAIVESEIEKKGFKKNISFFAFTATPKPKTIELFCERVNGKKDPFDEYSMEDAIKEGFIMDVMENYMSFKRYYKLIKKADIPDEEYEKKKTVRLLSNFVDIQDAAIERKARIMIEHFVAQTSKEIQGKARAMLVTRSRLHAVRFKRKFDDIMREMRLPYSALVAFSGSVKDAETGEDYTEASMNSLSGKFSIPEALKLPQYRFLIVANKYQTGFDEPLLHTMFVDKKLGGTSTVQTLSRLNRTKKGKESTMVLDFVNDPEAVQADFQKFYGKNFMLEEDETDPNSLYDLKSKIRSFDVFTKDDSDAFAEIFFRDNNNKEEVNGILDHVCKIAKAKLNNEQLELFRRDIKSFTNLYKFLSQIITFKDVELEKWHVFLVALYKKLPYQIEELPYDVLSSVELDSYKVQYQYTRSLKLDSGDTNEKGLSPADSHVIVEETDFLSNIIKTLNETYGIELTDEDKVELYRMKDKLYSNEELMSFFNTNNTKDNIQDKFNEEIDSELLNFINNKLELYNKLTDDRANTIFKRMWFNEIYDNRVRGIQ